MLKHIVNQISQHLLCDKRGLHSQQPLDLICTSPLCRQNPIACSVCFDQRHKHHNVISLSKFMDQFSRQSRNFDRKELFPQIERTHQHAKSMCKQLRKNINQKVDQFQKDIDLYKNYLENELYQKDAIHRLIDLKPTPQRMGSTINLSELRQSLKFILNNSKFNGEGQLSQISAPLKQNNEKIQSMISKLEYISFNCLRRVEAELNSLKELREIIGESKRNDVKIVNTSDTPAAKVRISKHQISEESTNVKKQLDLSSNKKDGQISIRPFATTQKTQHHDPQQQQCLSHTSHQPHYYKPTTFSITMKHPQLTLINNVLKSNVYGRQAHYALATPSLSSLPVSKWTIKIVSCRDIYCTNSLAIGICHLSQLKKKHLQARANDFHDAYLLTSSGDVLTPSDVSQNQGMRFKTGDILQMQYDSYYKLFEIKNEERRILSLKVEQKQDDPLFICARMTFLGDAIELINY